MSQTEQKLRSEARALLEQRRVDLVIGYEAGSLKFTTTPLITSDAADTDRLVVSPFMRNNLSVFLQETEGKVGIVARGCDSRSIVSLIQDQQVEREKVVIIGVPCAGLVDLARVEKLTGKDRDEIDDIAWEGEKAVVTIGNDKKEFAAKDVLADDCLGCQTPVPAEYDILLEAAGPTVTDLDLSRRGIKELEEMPPGQRWEYWKEQFSRCIRCYACRQVCPACFCKRCFVEESEPAWISPLPKWQDNLMFQVVRMLHDAGRCTDCGACERACPVNIPLRSLSKKMEEIVAELFDYRAGTDKDAPPLMAAYEAREAEEYFR
jgi:formate dehydrogenase subunit beta